MTSDRQLASNQRNAQRSTGPRTAAGKVVSSRNALKHGLFAEELLLQSEDVEEFQYFRAALICEWSPVGPTEELLVDRMVACTWRLRRALRAEQQDLERAVPSNGAELAIAPVSSDRAFDKTRGCQEAAHFLETTALGEIDIDCWDHLSLMDALYRWSENCLPEWYRLQSEGWAPEPGEILEAARTEGFGDEEIKAGMLAVLQEQIAAEVKLAEAQVVRLQMRGLGNEKTLRFEACIERAFYRALHELQRLQAKRAGEQVPGPATLDVDVAVHPPFP